MRTNTPVTNVEYVMKDGASIVSKTDVKGVITYVNPDFIEALKKSSGNNSINTH